MNCFVFNLSPGQMSYDIETYPNIFTFRCRHRQTGHRYNFEISPWRNDLMLLCAFMERCRDLDIEWVGFNNMGFDYPVCHFIYHNQNNGITYEHIYQKAMEIILPKSNFAHTIWESDHIVKQIDLFKIHHFDNKAKATSLKILEFCMRMESVEDLPFDVGTQLDYDQGLILKTYNDHDVDATEMFLDRTAKAIESRRMLSEQFGMNLINCNDVKIGEKILITEMEKAGVSCFERINGKKQKKQTIREYIDINNVVFPYVQFERQEFRDILEYLMSKTISIDEVTDRLKTKGVFTDLIATVEGCKYKFGTGGLHMSIDSQVVKSDDEYQLVDVDVASYYPNLAIKNQVYPAHLGTAFCDTLERIFQMRKQYPKSDPRNGALKLSLNGVYGLSNNEFSPFLDAEYTMSITVNGQLLLCMLVEQLIKVPGLSMVQANTDGVTFLTPKVHLGHIKSVCQWWEELTNLTLEDVKYSRMFIRDVNNYIAEKEDGELKRIGAYAYVTAEQDITTRELPYHKDWSARIVPMAAEAYLVYGTPLREFINSHDDDHDFLLRTKVPRSSSLHLGNEKVNNVIRYFIATGGAPLVKISPPKGVIGAYKRANKLTDQYYLGVIRELCEQCHVEYPPADEDFAKLPWDERINTKNQSVYEMRSTGIHTGWKVGLCERLSQFDRSDVNIEWYIKEAEKLCLLRGC